MDPTSHHRPSTTGSRISECTGAVVRAPSRSVQAPSVDAEPTVPASPPSPRAAGSEGDKKRKRVSLSCAECRRLKLKCSRVLWPCTSCVKRGCKELCPNGTLAPSGRTIKTVEERNSLSKRVDLLKQLMRENGLSDFIPRPTPGLKSTPGTSSDRSMEDEGEDEESNTVGTNVEDSRDPLVRGIGSLTLDEDGTSRYLGISADSTLFADDNTDALDTDDENHTGQKNQLQSGVCSTLMDRVPDSAAKVVSATRNSLVRDFPFASTSTNTLETHRMSLPSYAEALRLAQNYYEGVSFVFEPIAPVDFWTDYLEAVYHKPIVDGPKLAAVFMVLSLGSLFDRKMPATPNVISAQYFQEAQATLSASCFLSHASLPALQALHLCGNVLFNRHKLQESGETFFPMLGMAVKMAVSMGLHRDGAPWGLTKEECNRRRLAFWELVAVTYVVNLIVSRS